MVSDNYSKFISSIDIVKKMKESIEGVEKKMEKLEKSVNRINDLALKVDSTLETKRTEIKKLDLINKDLSGLRKLWEFPDLLKKELHAYKVNFLNFFEHLFEPKNTVKTPFTLPTRFNQLEKPQWDIERIQQE